MTAQRIAMTVKHRGSGSAEEWAGTSLVVETV
jgi:hypothetical protein